MKYQKSLIALVFIAMLGGCTSKIESGQIDYDNGIAYKHGSNEPFTGKVHFSDDDAPSFSGRIQRALNPEGLYVGTLSQLTYSCVASFKNGIPEGKVECVYDNGDKAISIELHDGRLNGEGIQYNSKGDAIFITHWKDGTHDGEQKMYSLDGDNVVHEWSTSEGRKLGKEYWGSDGGNDIAEGKWGDDGKFTGTMLLSGKYDAYPMLVVYTLKDGVKDGPFKQLDLNDPSRKKTIVNGVYDNGKKTGEWTYHGHDAVSNMGGEDAVPLGRWTDIPLADSTQLFRKDDKISGLVKILDKDGDTLLSFNYEDGKVLPPVMRFDPVSGKRFTLSDDVTIRAMNAANVRSSSMSNQPCLGPMLRQQTPGGVTYVFNYYCSVDYTRTQLSDIRVARGNHILDPVKFPDSPSDASMSKAEADAQAASTPSHGNALQTPSPITGLNFCVDDWLRSSYKGGDVIATQDQIDEWKQSCDQGKHPSNQGG